MRGIINTIHDQKVEKDLNAIASKHVKSFFATNLVELAKEKVSNLKLKNFFSGKNQDPLAKSILPKNDQTLPSLEKAINVFIIKIKRISKFLI